MKTILIVIGLLAVFCVLVILGGCVLQISDDDLLHQHPPDPDHKQWPQDGDEP